MSLWKRGNIWWAYFYVDGVRQQVSTGTSNKRQADLIFHKLKADANARRHQLVQVDDEMTFGALMTRFLAEGNVKQYQPDRLKQLLSYFADVPVVRITKGMADDYRLYRQSLKPVCDATVNRDLAVLRRILYWGLDEQLLEFNPLARMKMARERRTRRQVLSLHEEQQLLAVASAHLRALVIAALDTGMRRGEVTSQRWEDVDFSRRLLCVTRSKTPEGEAREIPFTSRLHELLSATRKDEGIVFGYQGAQVHAIKTTWRTALKNAGIRHVRFHDLRHTFNTRLMEAGVLQEIRMALMGHSSGAKVHAIYTHIELPVKREAIRKLETWVNQQQKELEKEHDNASTEDARTETGPGQVREPQTVEEENTRGGRFGTS